MIELHDILSSKERVIAASPTRHTPLRKATQQLSKRNVAAAKAELLNEALARLTALCYDMDARGKGAPPRAWNVDERTGRILVGVPMGSAGRNMYGLRRIERDVLRRVLVAHDVPSGDPPVYQYDDNERAWYLNFFDYRTEESARGWLNRNRITAQQWSDFSR